MKVYRDYSNEPVFEGLGHECLKFIMDKAFTFADGRKLYRKWEEDGKYFYDVGSVYYTTEPLIQEADGMASYTDMTLEEVIAEIDKYGICAYERQLNGDMVFYLVTTEIVIKDPDHRNMYNEFKKAFRKVLRLLKNNPEFGSHENAYICINILEILYGDMNAFPQYMKVCEDIEK